ncbi:MAG TPA: hypothetical protein DCZ03_11350 [Gammaproteobacteria bacterium]|nr:hypothetical protein [Gammaproteobacteria bacterium]
MKQFKILLLLSTVLAFTLPKAAFADLTELHEQEMRDVIGQALTAEQRELYSEMGEIGCRALCPTLSRISIDINATLKGGVTGALFGIDGDFGTGFIGQALNSIEGIF